jgi:periplasmic divalent cation tolerance protein
MNRPESAMGLLYTTWPDPQTAEAAAQALLAEGLIACANILGEGRSIFMWEGEVQHAAESVALFKTSAAGAEAAAQRIAELHPYEEPAILNLGVEAWGSSPAFIAWVAAQTSDASHEP